MTALTLCFYNNNMLYLNINDCNPNNLTIKICDYYFK